MGKSGNTPKHDFTRSGSTEPLEDWQDGWVDEVEIQSVDRDVAVTGDGIYYNIDLKLKNGWNRVVRKQDNIDDTRTWRVEEEEPADAVWADMV